MISELATRTANKLPPDVLQHPMPFPSRLEYAERIIQEALDECADLFREEREQLLIALGCHPAYIVQTVCDLIAARDEAERSMNHWKADYIHAHYGNRLLREALAKIATSDHGTGSTTGEGHAMCMAIAKAQL